MKNFAKIAGILLIAFLALSQFILPPIAARTIESRLKTLGKAEAVEARIAKMPALFMLLGKFDEVDLRAVNSQLGDVKVSELTLKGQNVTLPLSGLKHGFEVDSADKLEMTGVFTDKDLEYLIEKKTDKVKNVKVEITPQKIRAAGEVKIAGRMAQVALEGNVLADGSGVYFRMSSVKITNSILGKLGGNLFGDILLFDFNTLKLPVELDEVVQQNGSACIKASRH